MSRHYLVAGAIGAGSFVGQLLLAGAPNIGDLTAKSQALATEALAKAVATPSAGLWILGYFTLGVAAHAIPLVAATKLYLDLQERGPPPIRSIFDQRGSHTLILLVVLMAALSCDRWIFPTQPASSKDSAISLLGFAAPAVLSIILLTLLSILAATWILTAASRRARLAIAVACTLSLLPAIRYTPAPNVAKAQPDVIILGIDSLRPDHLATFGDAASSATEIDEFLGTSITFETAYTPLGRTFVAYMSILNGQYPINTGVRENLYPREKFNRPAVLPDALRKAGYITIFSIDESRFANLDESFGFDRTVMPNPGVIDFVMGTFYTTSATNLIQLLPGAWRIFPHTAGNRAASESYAPSVHTKKLRSSLRSAPSNRPLFLVAHLTIAHTPFATGRWTAEELAPAYQDSPAAYRKAVSIASDQFGEILRALRENGRLQNAVVILLSDHGEGLGMKKDRWAWQDSPRQPSLPPDFGHGNSALEDTQSKIVLAIQRYSDGKEAWQSKRTLNPASLVDVAPTILGLTNINQPLESDGIQLVDSQGEILAPERRPLFIESGISGKSLLAARPNNMAVANEFGYLYKVTDDLRFELLSEHLPNSLRRKQRGVILDNYGVAALPEGASGGCWLIVDYGARVRRCVDVASDDPIASTYSSLICEHFRKDLDFHAEWCTPPLVIGPH